jgi:high-affinity K+ transport system ATPase subunit B
LSGDRPQRVAALAQQLGLDDALGGCSPEDKVARVAADQAQGRRVLMVGDGVNDGPVLARADASLALMAVVYGIVGMLVGVIIAAQLTWPELNLGISWLSYGRCARCTPTR